MSGHTSYLRISLEHEEEAAEFPAVVVTSMTRGALTLSKLFANELDRQFG